jgi:prepilin peptidase CpaA
MTLATFASALACVLFTGAMLHVVVTDVLHRRIGNSLVAGMAAAYLPLALAAGLSGTDIATASFAALLVFAAGFGCFAAGWIGGGDAKLAPVCVLWLGAGQALPFLALTSLFGGVLALALIVTGALRRGQAAAVGACAPRTSGQVLPYGPALAIAGLTLLRDSPWAAAL